MKNVYKIENNSRERQKTLTKVSKTSKLLKQFSRSRRATRNLQQATSQLWSPRWPPQRQLRRSHGGGAAAAAAATTAFVISKNLLGYKYYEAALVQCICWHWTGVKRKQLTAQLKTPKN